MATEFDVVVIGSGAGGGAPIASELVKAGKSVLVMEKGPLFQPQLQESGSPSDFHRDELLATGPEKRLTLPLSNQGASFFSSHVEPDLNDEPHVYREGSGLDYATIEGYTAQVVGGGTQLYGAVSLRFTPDDFQLATFNQGRGNLPGDPSGDIQRETRNWPISYDDLEPYYVKTEELVGINGTRNGQLKPFSADRYQTPPAQNPISKFVFDGMNALGMTPYRTPLAVITEDHAPSGRTVPPDREVVKTAYVNRYGCPMGWKSNTWVALLRPVSKRPNFELRANCVVTHLGAAGGTVQNVFYRDPAGNERSVSGKIVIVACSAIESVRLLMLSALADPNFAARVYFNDLLGKYFLTHCFGGAECTVPGRFDKSMSLDSDWATDFCATAAYIQQENLWAGGAIYNNTSDQALPISLGRTHGSQDLDTIWQAFTEQTDMTGEKLAQFLDDNFGRRLSTSFMANQVPLKTNRIELHPTIRDKWGRPVAYIIKDWHGHDRYLMDKLAGQCAEILEAGVPGVGSVERGGVYMAGNARARIANHILGGARFGDSESDSVLDKDCRAWRFDNLYVTDGAFMPTSGSANPTLTIQANAFRVADLLKARL